ncbi:MAG: hypothetical protein HYT37_03305 [Candidatus Sungbacteria bacterium]|nr:hypothetical protein [Candidatus Sungbacteria bacterium]
MDKTRIFFIVFVVLALVGVFSQTQAVHNVFSLSRFDFAATAITATSKPLCDPPNCNTPEPLNVGAVTQQKLYNASTGQGDIAMSGNLTVRRNILFSTVLGTRLMLGATSPEEVFHPGVKLDITSAPGRAPNSQVGMYIRNTGTVGDTGLAIQKGGTWDAAMFVADDRTLVIKSRIGTKATGKPPTPISFNTDDIGRLYITGDGKVGIGTLSPEARLEVNGNFSVINGNVGIGTNAPAYFFDVTRPGFAHFAGNNSGVIPASSASGGLLIGWNKSGGAAEVNFFNAYNNASTAFMFSQKTGASTLTDLMVIRGNGNVGIGVTNPTAKLEVNGSFKATTKSFLIAHPAKQGMLLEHGSLEGPEHGVFYRGEGKLQNGKVIIELPDYFESLTRKEGRTVLITPKMEMDDETVSALAASSVRDGVFIVRSIGGNNQNQAFYWEVKAIRADVPLMRVEQAQ